MKQIDQQYLATPFYGSRRMKVWLDRQGHRVNRKRIQRLMRAMGLQAIYRRPPYQPANLGQGATRRHGVHPAQPAADITYVHRWPGASSTWWEPWRLSTPAISA